MMKSKRLVERTLVFFMSTLFLFSAGLSSGIKTPAEKTNYTRYTQIEDIALFLSELDILSPRLNVRIIGQTLNTREYHSREFYLCILNEEGVLRPEGLNREKPTLLLIAAQHGNEQSAKEAALWLIRDLVAGELQPLLSRLNLLIIPTANPYGNFFDRRRNEQDLDLNRDHVKLESPEVRAIHGVFRAWMPEVTMDVHEKGDDYYRVSIGCVSNANISSLIQEFSREIVLAEVEESLAHEKITFHEYLITQPMGIDSSAGVTYLQEDLKRRETMKRYSTTDLNDGRNSLGIYESLSFIQEGASRHDLPTLKERTRWQYFGLRFFAESIARHGPEINTLVRGARHQLLEKTKAYIEDDRVHLRMLYARDPGQPTLRIKTFKRAPSPIRGILRIDKKAGDPLTLADIAPYPYPPFYTVEEEVVKNWFPMVEPTVTIPRPLGYIIPAAYGEVVENLRGHQIQVNVFTEDAERAVEAYEIRDIKPAAYDYLPPESIVVDKKNLRLLVKRGDYFVSCAQPAANLIPCLLEPESQYGLIRYQTFQLVPRAGTVYPFTRLVETSDLPMIPFKNWVR